MELVSYDYSDEKNQDIIRYELRAENIDEIEFLEKLRDLIKRNKKVDLSLVENDNVEICENDDEISLCFEIR